MSISRCYAWLDENVEHSDRDAARAKALAAKWSALKSEEEQRRFARQSDMEDGWTGFWDEWEPEPCETCGGSGKLGLSSEKISRHGVMILPHCGQCGEYLLIGIACTNPHCENGNDMAPVRQHEQELREKQAERELEIEMVECKLAALGARIMRPYEHWNEDERYMQYMEVDRFQESSY